MPRVSVVTAWSIIVNDGSMDGIDEDTCNQIKV
jgi:hypothetical protein